MPVNESILGEIGMIECQVSRRVPVCRRGGPVGVFVVAAVVGIGAMAAGAVGCSRALNERTSYERVVAAEHHRTQGEYDLQHGRVVEALAHFTEAVRIEPRDAASHWGLARLYVSVGFEVEAASAAERARAIDDRYRAVEPEAVKLERPEVAAAMITRRPPPSDAKWIAE